MENTISMGMNRTGVQMAPLSKDDMADFANEHVELVPHANGGRAAILRGYVEEAESVGSVPVPGTLKGMATTGIAKLTGDKPEVFIDKLGERLAFERTGTRLYEALIAKCTAQEGIRDSARGSAAANDADGMHVGPATGAMLDLELLHRIRDDEEAHFALVQSALLELGADPTAMTPCADVAGVMSMGLLQTVSDPRTSVPQSLKEIGRASCRATV